MFFIVILSAGMEAPLSLPSSPVSLRPLHLLLLLLLGLALLTLLLFSYGAFPSGDTPPTHPLWLCIPLSFIRQLLRVACLVFQLILSSMLLLREV